MYRRPKFLEVLLEIRREMAHEADYDVDLFAEIVRSGHRSAKANLHSLVSPEPDMNGRAPNKAALKRQPVRKTRVR
jgi:hypothetical protein